MHCLLNQQVTHNHDGWVNGSLKRRYGELTPRGRLGYRHGCMVGEGHGPQGTRMAWCTLLEIVYNLDMEQDIY